MATNLDGQTALSQACLDNDIDKVEELLKACPLCTQEKNWNGSIALNVAAKFSSLEIVQLVLADTPKELRNTINIYHNSVYDYATQRGEDLGDSMTKELKSMLLESKHRVLDLLKNIDGMNENSKCFQFGKYYLHTTGETLFVCAHVKTEMWGETLIAERNTPDAITELITVGKEADAAVNYTEITRGEYMKRNYTP